MATATPAKFHSDGAAVTVTLTSTVVKGDVAYASGFLGVTGADGDSDDAIGLELDMREYIFDVGASLSVAKGDTVWVTVNSLTGHLPNLSGYATASGSNRIRLFRATTAKDTSNKVHGILISALGLS